MSVRLQKATQQQALALAARSKCGRCLRTGSGRRKVSSKVDLNASLLGQCLLCTGKKAGDHWAPALSADGRYLAITSHEGKITVYDTAEIDRERNTAKVIANFETKGSFGMSVDIVGVSTTAPTLL